MAKICPLCNKINDLSLKCERCDGYMENIGRVQDYSDPYGPQDPINDTDTYCIHLFKCKNCDNKQKTEISKVSI